jgi:hypothetical protein
MKMPLDETPSASRLLALRLPPLRGFVRCCFSSLLRLMNLLRCSPVVGSPPADAGQLPPSPPSAD